MNDGHYTNIRNFLEEIAGQQREILAAVQRTNELLEKFTSPFPILADTGNIDLSKADMTPVVMQGESKVERVTQKPATKTAAKKSK